MARRAGERWECEGCGQALVGALTINHKVAPVEMATREDGNVWLGRRSDGTVICATLSGLLIEEARRVGIALRRNHWSDKDCPFVVARRASRAGGKQ